MKKENTSNFSFMPKINHQKIHENNSYCLLQHLYESYESFYFKFIKFIVVAIGIKKNEKHRRLKIVSKILVCIFQTNNNSSPNIDSMVFEAQLLFTF